MLCPYSQKAMHWRRTDAIDIQPCARSIGPSYVVQCRSFTARLQVTGCEFGRNEMDPPLCGSTSMSHNEFKIREPM